MLLGFGAKNIYSFREGFEVNLKLGAGCPNNISNGKDYTNVLAIKGANASGKTNVLKVLSFLSNFTTNSFDYKLDEEIPFFNFFENTDNTHLYIIFIEDNIEYKYELELNKTKIISEKIYKKNILIIDRKNNKLLKTTKDYADINIIKLRSNVSLISTANQYDIDSIKTIYSLFNNIISNVGYSGMVEEFINYKKVSELYHKEEEIFNFIKDILIKSDTGIKDIIIHEKEDKETDEVTYFPIFVYEIDGVNKYLTYHEQSSGVKSLFKQLGAYKIVLNNSGVLVLDEFDINLHPDLLPILIHFFTKNNENDAQLVFTTHNTEIMDELKKYRIIFVNKEDNESFLYRLDEVSDEIIRNDRSLINIYNSNKVGGKPRLML